MFKTTNSIKPRVFIKAPIAKLSFQFCPTNFAANALPKNFPTTATAIINPVIFHKAGSFNKPIWVRKPVNTKNNGNNTIIETSSTFSINIFLNLLFSGIIAPAKKAPNKAWIPINSDAYAEIRRVIKKIATTGLFKLSLVEFKSPTRFRNGRTIFNIIITYKIASPITYKALVKEPAFTIAITTAKIHQAVISSAAAQVMAMVPNFVFCIPRSCTILARTGNAVILMAIPIKSPKEANSTPTGANVW